MPIFSLNDPAPQFDTVEYAGQTAADRCHFCGQTVVGSYYRTNDQMACASCTDRLRRGDPEPSHAAFLRAVLLGSCAAAAGLIGYAAFGIITGWMIGYLSFAVGWLIAKAMMAGSGGIGGRRYQVVAVLLTYMAVSMAAVPIYIAQIRKESRGIEQAKVHSQSAPGQTDSSASTSEDQPEASPADNETGSAPKKASMSPAYALMILVLVGLASPFLALTSPVHGLIGLFILWIGLQIAWRNTAGKPAADIMGPFDVSASAPPGAGI